MSEKKDWRAAVLDVLPEKSKELLARLEEFAGREIVFAAYTTPPDDGEVNPDAPATEMTAAGARILLRDGMPIPAQGVTHELLHIERYWVEGVPQLFPANPANGKNCAQMENALEHLVIVPREAAYGFEPYGHWNDTYGKRWTGDRLAPTKPSAVLRMEALMGWLATSTVTDEVVKATMAKIIQDAGFFSEAEKFKARMNEFVPSKEKMAKCLARFLKIPDGAVVLRYFNAKAGTIRDEKVGG
jgi:hypothetical protein